MVLWPDKIIMRLRGCHVGQVRARPRGPHDRTGLGESFQELCLPSPISKGQPNASGRTGPTSGGPAIKISADGKGLNILVPKVWMTVVCVAADT